MLSAAPQQCIIIARMWREQLLYILQRKLGFMSQEASFQKGIMPPGVQECAHSTAAVKAAAASALAAASVAVGAARLPGLLLLEQQREALLYVASLERCIESRQEVLRLVGPHWTVPIHHRSVAQPGRSCSAPPSI